MAHAFARGRPKSRVSRKGVGECGRAARSVGGSSAAPLGGIRQHEPVQTGEQQEDEREHRQEAQPVSIRSRLLSRLRWPAGRFNTELLGVLRVQPLPAGELHGLGADHACNGLTGQKLIQNIESNVPSGSTH